MKPQRPIDSIVALAHSEMRTWCVTPLSRRIEILRAFADQLRARKSELTETISQETGKPRWESASEVDAMRKSYAIADVLLGVSLVSLGTGTYFFFKQTDEHTPQGSARTLWVQASGRF